MFFSPVFWGESRWSQIRDYCLGFWVSGVIKYLERGFCFEEDPTGPNFKRLKHQFCIFCSFNRCKNLHISTLSRMQQNTDGQSNPKHKSQAPDNIAPDNIPDSYNGVIGTTPANPQKLRWFQLDSTKIQRFRLYLRASKISPSGEFPNACPTYSMTALYQTAFWGQIRVFKTYASLKNHSPITLKSTLNWQTKKNDICSALKIQNVLCQGSWS